VSETPSLPTPQSDRDDEVAATLAVPPLEESTRRVLVRLALDEADAGVVDEAAPRRFGRWGPALGLAAALVIGAVVGAAIVTQPGDQGTRTAAQAPTTQAGEGRAKAAPEAADQQSAAEAPAAASSAPAVDLGDLGTVSGPDAIKDAVRARLEAGTGSTSASVPCLNPSSNAAAGIYGLVVISAAGTATLDGSEVVVLVGPTTAGEDVAVVLDVSRGCAFVRNIHL
jgi:hypothetical protein